MGRHNDYVLCDWCKEEKREDDIQDVDCFHIDEGLAVVNLCEECYQGIKGLITEEGYVARWKATPEFLAVHAVKLRRHRDTINNQIDACRAATGEMSDGDDDSDSEAEEEEEEEEEPLQASFEKSAAAAAVTTGGPAV